MKLVENSENFLQIPKETCNCLQQLNTRVTEKYSANGGFLKKIDLERLEEISAELTSQK